MALGCSTAGGRGEEAKALVTQAFADRASGTGAVGVEALGKGVWYRADALNTGCLQTKAWAFRGKSGGDNPRFSPTYEAQRAFQYPTDEGYCLWIGDDLSMTAQTVSRLGEAWIVDVEFAVARPAGWWECVDDGQRRAPVRVVEVDGALQIESDPALFGGACPRPLPVVNFSRKASSSKPRRPPRPPTRAEIVDAARKLDDALWAHDLAAALQATACYNLYEEEPFGACSAAELVNVGPIPRGDIRRSDGPPWSMNAFDDLEAIGSPERDRADKTMFHAQVKAAGRHPRRTIAVQWVDDAWRMVGIVQRKAEGLTSVEYVVDLARPERRDIFDRRREGEAIDFAGNPEGG